jgi:hypothetical protein
VPWPDGHAQEPPRVAQRPAGDRVAAELDRLHQASAWRADDDLVFAMPETGRPPDRSDLHRRFKATLRVAGVRDVRFP